MTLKQENLLEAMMRNPTMTKAIEEANIGRSTAYKYLKDPEFQRELQKRKTEAMNGALRYLQGMLGICAENLFKIANDEDNTPLVRIRAIEIIYTNCRAMTETADIMNRLIEIETRINEGGKRCNEN